MPDPTPTPAPQPAAPFDWQKLLHVLIYAAVAFVTAKYGITIPTPQAKVDVTVPPLFGHPVSGAPGDTPQFRAIELTDREGKARLVLSGEDGANAKVYGADGKSVGAVEFEKLFQRRRLFGDDPEGK